MPNWCNNTLVIKHQDPAMITRAMKAFVEGKFLNEFVPIPESLHIVSGRCGADDNPEQIALEAAQKSNIEQYGYKDWYDFSVNEWGTKWDVGDSDGINEVTENSLTVYFDSAWAPPCGVYEKLTDLGFEVDAMYNEPGMGFCGRWTNESGDEYYELSGRSADELDELLPKEINEAFCITEDIRMWEEENKEEEENE
jgi:Ferredoxin-like domain in Api92-like protein